MSDDAAPAIAVVTGQSPRAGVDPTGRGGPGVEIEFRTAKGLTGTVWVPQATFSQAAVAAAVKAAASEMDAVQGMSVY